jgi:hypothetical protein
MVIVSSEHLRVLTSVQSRTAWREVMDSMKVLHELELIRSAAIKAEDEGVKQLDNSTLAWCLKFIESKIQNIREEAGIAP